MATPNLIDQMKMVAQQFLGRVPIGSYYDVKGVLYTVGGFDPKTGEVLLNPVNGGGVFRANPINDLGIYPNAVPAPIAPAAVATSGGGLQSLLGLGGTVAPVAQMLATKKGAAAAAGAKTGLDVVQATKLDLSGALPKQGSLALVNDPGNLVANVQQHLDTATSALNKFLNSGANTGLPVPISIDQMSSLNDAMNIAKANLEVEFQMQIKTAQSQLKQIDDALGNAVGGQPLPDSINDIFSPHYDPLQPVPPASTTNYVATPDYVTTSYTPQQQSLVDSLYDSRVATENRLTSLKAPTAQTAFVDKGMQNFNDAYKQWYDAKYSVLPQAQAYNSAITQALAAPASSGQMRLAGLELEKQGGVSLKFDDQGLPDMTDKVTAEAVNQQVATDTKQFLSQYAPADAAKIKDGMADYQDTRSYTQADKLESQILRGQEIKFGIELAAAAGAGYAEENALQSLFSKGFSFKEFATAAGSAVGMYVALHMMNGLLFKGSPLLQMIQNLPVFGHALGSFFKFITSGWGFLAIQGALLLISALFKSTPSAEQQAAETLNAEVNPLVWNPNGQVIFLTAGLTIATLGLNLSPTAPMMQTMTVSQAQATAALTAAGASSVPTDNTRYADVFVQQGAAGSPTRVVYLTPGGTDSKGNVIETMTVQTLKPGMQFANSSSQPTSFIPFFINAPGSPRKVNGAVVAGGGGGGSSASAQGGLIANPQMAKALSDQQHLLLCADGAWVSDAKLCAAAAGATSHVTGSSSGN